MDFENFITFKLGDFSDIQNGYAFKSDEFKTAGTPVVKIKNIENSKINLNDAQYYNGEITERLSQFVIQKNDVLISMTGSNVNQMASAVGKVGRYQFDFPALINQRVGKIFITKPKIANLDYLYYLLNRVEIQYELAASAGGSANQANISPTQIKNLRVSLPSLSLQNKVVHLLSSIDDKIELNRQINETLENIAQAIFKEWFVDFNFYLKTGLIKTMSDAPSGWKLGKLGDIVVNHDSKRVPLSKPQREKRRGKFPYYGAASIVDYIDNYLFDGTYVLVGEDGTVITDDEKPILQYVTGKFWVNNHAHVLQGNNNFSTEYIYLLLQNTNIKHLVTGAVQPKINQANLNSIKILIPDKSILDKFNIVVQPVFKLKLNNEQQSRTLAKLRDTLLPKLMSGEISIKDTEKQLVDVL